MLRLSSRIVLIGSCLVACAWTAHTRADEPDGTARQTRIRAGFGRTIVEFGSSHKPTDVRSSDGAVASTSYAHPRPRLVGFSPLVAITTSNKRSEEDIHYEHELHASYIGVTLNPDADPDFVIGYLDSGSVVDLAAGSARDTLGLTGANLTSNYVPIGGVGGTVDAQVSQPLGFFAAGLSSVDAGGLLDFSALVGHSNVSGLAVDPLLCGDSESLTAIVGTPFMAFYNTMINVDTPLSVTVGGQTFTGPDVQILQTYESLPTYSHAIALEFGGLMPVMTASYYPVLDPEDLITPLFPTMLSFTALSLPLGGAFFTTIQVLQGEPGPTNTAQSMRVMVDTGAQSSIMSPGMAANLGLSMTPDFPVSVCGVGGLVEDVPGYYIDYVKINAWGGALEFSRAPFVVLDLESPEGGPLDGVLGMNFFWNRNIVFEPSLTGSGFFHVSDPIPVAFGDTDVDFDVDYADAAYFVSCLTAPGSETLNPECDQLDGDEDSDVDLADVARLQRCFSGADVTADPNCGL